MIFKCRIIVLYWILLFFPCSAIWLLLKVTTMRTCSPKFPDIYAIESTFSKRQMAQSIEVENLCKTLFFKKIFYKNHFLLIFFLILLYQNLLYKMKCKCLSKTFNLLKEIFALIWQHCLLHSYPLSHSSCKHMAVDLKSNQEKTNFISAFYKLTILTENNVHFLIRKKRRKRLFPTFVQTLVWNMTFFCTVIQLLTYMVPSSRTSLQNANFGIRPLMKVRTIVNVVQNPCIALHQSLLSSTA